MMRKFKKKQISILKMFKVIGTDTYLKEISKWSNPEIEAAEQIAKQVS